MFLECKGKMGGFQQNTTLGDKRRKKLGIASSKWQVANSKPEEKLNHSRSDFNLTENGSDRKWFFS